MLTLMPDAARASNSTKLGASRALIARNVLMPTYADVTRRSSCVRRCRTSAPRRLWNQGLRAPARRLHLRQHPRRHHRRAPGMLDDRKPRRRHLTRPHAEHHLRSRRRARPGHRDRHVVRRARSPVGEASGAPPRADPSHGGSPDVGPDSSSQSGSGHSTGGNHGGDRRHRVPPHNPKSTPPPTSGGRTSNRPLQRSSSARRGNARVRGGVEEMRRGYRQRTGVVRPCRPRQAITVKRRSPRHRLRCGSALAARPSVGSVGIRATNSALAAGGGPRTLRGPTRGMSPPRSPIGTSPVSDSQTPRAASGPSRARAFLSR